MTFTHDTEVALTSAAALVNTAALIDPARADTARTDTAPTDTGAGEQLGDVAELDAFVRSWGWTGSRTHDEAELAAVRALRPRLRRVWASDEEQAVAIVNGMLADAAALPQLVKHGEWDYHLHATPPDAPLDVRMAVEAAMALVDLIRSKEMSRLRTCEYPGCENVLVDLSRNRSRRFCDDGCGNRAAVAAYRARRAGSR